MVDGVDVVVVVLSLLWKTKRTWSRLSLSTRRIDDEAMSKRGGWSSQSETRMSYETEKRTKTPMRRMGSSESTDWWNKSLSSCIWNRKKESVICLLFSPMDISYVCKALVCHDRILFLSK